MKPFTRALTFFTLLLTASFAAAQPFIVKIPDQTIQEDSATAPLPIRFSFPDLNLSRLAVDKGSSDTNVVPLAGIAFGGTGTNRTVRVSPKQNANGTSTISITLSDGQQSASTAFKVTVTPVNDLPFISNILDTSTPVNTPTLPIGFLVADPDNPVTSLTLSGASDNQTVVANNEITFAGAGTNRTVTLTPVQNATGSANITVVVSDGVATASQAFKITVTSQTGNGVPVITQQPKSTNVVEGTPVVLQVVATGPELRYQWRFNGQDIPNQTSATLTIPKTTTAHNGDFTVRVFNEFGQTTSDKATVTVTTGGSAFDFGDAPTPYPTLRPNGAAQAANPKFGLGGPPDTEADGQPNATASGDDANGDDENGVVVPLQLFVGRTNRVAVFLTDSLHAAPSGWLTVWLDLNSNGSWDDAGERFGPFHLQNAGSNSIPIIVPAGVTSTASFARFRLTADTPTQSPKGSNDEAGEVEDYPVTFQQQEGPGPGTNLDFGDAPDAYKTRLASDGPRHTLVQGFNLGKTIDLEPDAVLPLNGRGDDATPATGDDEDGVFLPTSFTPGQTATIQVLANIANGAGKLDAWFDWSRNGSFGEAGEKMINSQTVTNGTNRFTFLLPATATNGPSFARFRLTRQGINSWFGAASDGEVEDYLIQISGEQQEQFDFGDAPQTANGGYPTKLDRDGARHHLLEGLHLGRQIDLEPDGQPNATATGDDTQNTQDEDGVFFPAALIPGITNVVEVTVSTVPGATAFLDAWIDFNGDLDWSDAGEKIFSARPVVSGTQTLNFLVPANAKSGVTFARFRLSQQQSGLDFTGDGGNGEVEDLRVSIVSAEDQHCDLSCMGKDFWVAFPGNYAPQASTPVIPILHMIGPSNAVVTIENLAVNNTTKWTNTTGTLHIDLRAATDLGDLNDTIASKAVHITSTAPITLYGLSKVNFTSDGYAGLPTEALGTEYIVVTFGNVHTAVPELNGTQFAIVATETNTAVTIIPSTQTGIHDPGVAYSITLTNRGDVYQLRNLDDAPADLTGTAILADKRIVVYGSHRIANVASSDPFFADYLVETLLPVTRWGKEFYTQPLTNRSGGDTFRMVASADDTSLTINGSVVATLNRGEFFETLLDEASAISADKPIEVMQFANSSDFDGVVNSDPFMVTVPARSHWSPSQTFTTPLNGFASHYVNVVLTKSAAASLRLDGSGAAFTAFSEIDALYTATSASVSPGTHSITCNEPVGLIVYGWNRYESYAWPACLFLGDTTPPVVQCTATNVVVVAGRDSDNEPCKARLGDYRDRIRGTDNCGLPEQGSVRQTPPPGTFLGVGTHTITLSVRDNAGNIGSCTFDFTVTDPNPNGDISFTCPQDFAVRCTSTNGAIVNYNVVAFRGCTPLTTNLTCVPPPGSLFPPGTNKVTCVLRIPGRDPQVCSFNVLVDCRRPRSVKVNQPTLTAPGAAPDITIEFDDDPHVTLEVANNITGPWLTVTNAPPRYVIKAAKDRGKFFRLKDTTPQ